MISLYLVRNPKEFSWRILVLEGAPDIPGIIGLIELYDVDFVVDILVETGNSTARELGRPRGHGDGVDGPGCWVAIDLVFVGCMLV
jgi:hypothetical protein